jgi:hypothetical protein
MLGDGCLPANRRSGGNGAKLSRCHDPFGAGVRIRHAAVIHGADHGGHNQPQDAAICVTRSDHPIRQKSRSITSRRGMGLRVERCRPTAVKKQDADADGKDHQPSKVQNPSACDAVRN